MAHLTLVGLSEDRTRLLLVDAAGDRFTLDVDNALRSAVRGEQPRPGHLETRMDSALRPRDIQARIRAGATAEAVAQAAGSTVEKIMPYAAPVLAERAHVADRAQKSSVRRRATDGSGPAGGGRTLAEAVAWQLRANNVDPESVEWDAYRRDDGRWSLTGLYETEQRAGVATFTYDVPGNYVTLEDDDARWLVGDARTTTPETLAPQPEGGRRLSAVPSPLGDDAIELVQQDRAVAADIEQTVDLTESLAQSRPVESFVDPAAPEPEPTSEQPAARTPQQDEPAEQPDPAPRKTAKKRGRASVPSWDEIMFGGGSGE